MELYLPNIKHFILNILIKTRLQNYLLKRHTRNVKSSLLEGVLKIVKEIIYSDQNISIRMTYNTNESPETHAEIIPTLMLARFYASIGKNVQFEWIPNFPNDKPIISGKDNSKLNAYFSDQIKLITKVFSGFDNINFNNFSLSDNLEMLDLNKIIQDLNLPIYRLASLILDESVKSWISSKRDLPQSFYLDHGIEKTGSIAINFRYANYDRRRNPSLFSFKKDLAILRKYFPEKSIIIFSDKRGIDKITQSKLISNSLGGFSQISIQQSTTYSEAVFEALQSDFFFMRKGGGMCMPFFYSNSETNSERPYNLL